MYLPTNLNYNYNLVYISYILLFIAVAFFMGSSSSKKRLYYIIGTMFFFSSMVYAVIFYIYDLVYSFSLHNIPIDIVFILLHYNGSLLLGFLCMIIFSSFSILIDYNMLKISKSIQQIIWFIVSVFVNFCILYHIAAWNSNPVSETLLILTLVDSLENYMYFPFIYFLFIEGKHCNRKNS